LDELEVSAPPADPRLQGYGIAVVRAGPDRHLGLTT